jgi:hypothetical protein
MFLYGRGKNMIANLEPGLHNLSSDVYHADPCRAPSLSSSIANILLMQSPAHAWLAHPRLNPNFQRETDSRFDLGSAAHAMLLERDESRVVIVEADDWRTKAAREARDAAQANGQYAILARQYADVQKMVQAAHSYIQTTEVRGILDTGIPEQSLIWNEFGIWCRARPDLISDDQRIVLDYKTTESAQPDVFGRQIGRMGYDLQAEFYLWGMNAVIHKAPTFVFLVQEISPPYACSLISLSNAYRAIGASKLERAIKLWNECLSTNRWPAYPTQICYTEPTAYQLADMEHQNDW